MDPRRITSQHARGIQTALHARTTTSSQPTAPAPTLNPAPPSAGERHRLERTLRLPLVHALLIFAVLAVIALGTIAVSQFTKKHATPIPESISKQLSYTLYYPYNLPAGYSVDTSSFVIKDKDVLVFA